MPRSVESAPVRAEPGQLRELLAVDRRSAGETRKDQQNNALSTVAYATPLRVQWRRAFRRHRRLRVAAWSTGACVVVAVALWFARPLIAPVARAAGSVVEPWIAPLASAADRAMKSWITPLADAAQSALESWIAPLTSAADDALDTWVAPLARAGVAVWSPEAPLVRAAAPEPAARATGTLHAPAQAALHEPALALHEPAPGAPAQPATRAAQPSRDEPAAPAPEPARADFEALAPRMRLVRADALLQSNKPGALREARGLAESAADSLPNDPHVYASLAQACLRLDDASCARASIAQALRYRPRDGRYRALSHRIRARFGRP